MHRHQCVSALAAVAVSDTYPFPPPQRGFTAYHMAAHGGNEPLLRHLRNDHNEGIHVGSDVSDSLAPGMVYAGNHHNCQLVRLPAMHGYLCFIV